MNDEILKKNLKQSLQQIPAVIHEKHLKDTLLLARKETCLRKRRKRISFIGFLSGQIAFIGWKIWIIQGFFLCILHGMLVRFYEYCVTPQTMVKLLFCLSILVFMSVLPLLYRSVRYQMQEIEAVSRFSCQKLLLSRLLIIGIGDIFLLGSIFLSTMLKTTLPAGSAMLYLCFPFLLAGSGCLYMIGHFTPRRSFTGSLSFCFFLILVFCVIPSRHAFWFQQSLSCTWIMVCALLFVFCLQQFGHILKDSRYTEAQLVV